MHAHVHRIVLALAVALIASACGGTSGVSVDPLASGADDDVLSPCEPAGEQETTVLVEASGQLPPVSTMEDAVSGHPDLDMMLADLQAEGRSREQALHVMYAQVVGERLLTQARQLPGFVTGAYARPMEGEPFELSFAGPVPEELDPSTHDLETFGLQVTSGAVGFDGDAMAAAFEAAEEVGMHPVSGSGDETTGTGRIEVLDATPEQVAAWEQAVAEPSRWCLVRAPRSQPCDDAVIADAEQRAERQGEVLPNEQGEASPTVERAGEVRRSYLGLTVEEAEAKAEQEGRAVRVIVQDGVQLGGTDDLRPGRLSLTVCDGVVVDTRMDAEPRG